MRKLKNLLLTVCCVLCFCGICFAGCGSTAPEGSVKGRTLIAKDSEYISFCTGYTSSFIGMSYDKKEIDDILGCFYNANFYEAGVSVEDYPDFDPASVTVYFENATIYINTYKDGAVTFKKVDKDEDNAVYYSTLENAVSYKNLVNKMDSYRSNG